MKFSILLSVIVIGFGFCCGTIASAGWQIETVDSAENVGQYTSLALDGAGYPHISYYDYGHGDLMYARWTGLAWAIEAVDTTGEVGQYTSIAVNTVGYPMPCISYYDNTTHSLKFAERVAGDPPWDITVLDSIPGGVTGKYTSLALDDSGNHHISYYNETGGKLMYIKRVGASWGFPERVGPLTAGDWGRGGTSLVVNGSGTPHIGYYDEVNEWQKYAYKTPTSWHIETAHVESMSGGPPSLMLDGSGNPHMSYRSVPHSLNYAWRTASGWNTVSLDGGWVSGENSFAMDHSGNPHISYHTSPSSTYQTLNYAGKVGSFWHTEIVDSGVDLGTYSSIATDADNHPHISYFDSANGHLKYAKYVLTPINIGVFRPSAWGNWILNYDMDGDIDLRDHYGISTDLPIVGDFNNDGNADRALFRSGEWIIDYGMDGSINNRPVYGIAGDIPLIGRMNADEFTDYAVFRNGQWIIDRSMDGTVDVRDIYGIPGDIPMIGDFNNDGIPDRAVFRSSAWDNWIFDYSIDRDVDLRNHYGDAGDIPLIGDFNVDGITDRAVFRNGEWIIDYSMDGTVNSRPRFGTTGDIPLAWNA